MGPLFIKYLLHMISIARRVVTVFAIVTIFTALGYTEAANAQTVGLKGWQLNDTNTGLAGVGVDRNTLPVYTGPTDVPAGTTIRLQKITTPLNLRAGNITLDRVWVHPTTSSGTSGMITTYDVNIGGGAQNGPVTIMDSDIDGSAVTDTHIYGDCAVRGAANLYRNNMWGMGSGICYFGAASMTNVVIEQNYVHNLRGGLVLGTEQSHNESGTIRDFSGTSMVWRNNQLISKSGSDSGALFNQAYTGPINNVLIEGNLMDSYGWDLVLEPNPNSIGNNMRARDNRFGLSGYGVGYVSGSAGWAEWSSNYLYDATKTNAAGAPAPCPGGACVNTAPSTPAPTVTISATPTLSPADNHRVSLGPQRTQQAALHQTDGQARKQLQVSKP
jgi:hypothetical protein